MLNVLMMVMLCEQVPLGCQAWTKNCRISDRPGSPRPGPGLEYNTSLGTPQSKQPGETPNISVIISPIVCQDFPVLSPDVLADCG